MTRAQDRAAASRCGCFTGAVRKVVGLAVAFIGVAALYGAAAVPVQAGPAAELAPVLAYSAPDGIHLIRADGTDDHRVPTSRSGDDVPAWSPDGHRLAVISKRNGAGFGRLVVLDLVAGRRLQLPAAGSSVASASWSSDGSTVYFDNGAESVLSSIRSDGSHLAKPLGKTPAIYPAVGPDGRLAYTYNWYPAPSIFVFDPALGIAPGTPVTRDDAWGPAWWPDGQSLVFMTEKFDTQGGNGSDDSHVEIYRVNTDGSNEQRLTDNNVWDGDPNVSPDGTQVAFDTGRYGWLEVELMNADGSNHRRLTYELRGDAQAPAWRP